jgi:adenylylsulfate kinase
MDEKRFPTNHITWYNGHVSREDREKLHGHRGAVLWFTGLSASGKSTVAHLVEKELHLRGCSTYTMDGDNVRHGLCRDLSFSQGDRAENIRRIGEMARLYVDAGLILLTAFISPFRRDRRFVRSLVGDGHFLEIYMSCPVEVCERRDEKGIYRLAKAGRIKEFTGISSPYEPPQNPDLVVETQSLPAPQAAVRVLKLIEARGIIQRAS